MKGWAGTEAWQPRGTHPPQLGHVGSVKPAPQYTLPVPVKLVLMSLKKLTAHVKAAG